MVHLPWQANSYPNPFPAPIPNNSPTTGDVPRHIPNLPLNRFDVSLIRFHNGD
jgi:hypothetical protein